MWHQLGEGEGERRRSGDERRPRAGLQGLLQDELCPDGIEGLKPRIASSMVLLGVLKETAARYAAIPSGEHAPGKAEISAQKPIVVARFHGQAVLQRRVLACLPTEAHGAKEGTSAKIDRASTGIRAGGCGRAKPGSAGLKMR